MRKITGLQIMVFSFLFAVSVGMSILTTAVLLGGLPLGDVRGITMLAAGFVLVYVYAMLVYRLFLEVMPLREGDLVEGSREEFAAQVHNLFYLLLFNTLVRSSSLPIPLMRLVCIALGAKMGKNSYSGGTMLDPALTILGDNVLVGDGATLFAHAMEGRHYSLEAIRVGNNVTIGARSVVMSGVKIGDGAIVSAGAVVKKGTHIGAGETWGGVPAKCIRPANAEVVEALAPAAGESVMDSETKKLHAEAYTKGTLGVDVKGGHTMICCEEIRDVTEKVECNLCHTEDSRKLFKASDSLTNRGEEFSVVQCNTCNLVYVSPRPTSNVISEFYPSDFVSYQFEIFDAKESSLRERLITYLTRTGAQNNVKKVKKLVSLKPSAKVLDVGCGKGSFLAELRSSTDCDVAGMDFDEGSVEYCKHKLGLDVFCQEMSSLENHEEKYDLITMWHCLEHECDPVSTLTSIHKNLDDKGSLIVEVPNAESLENQIFKNRSYLYDLPRHLYHFSPRTIEEILQKAGFEVESIGFSLMCGGWIGTLQGLLSRGRIFRNLKENIYSFFFLSMLSAPLDLFADLIGRGSIMTVVAKKAGQASCVNPDKAGS